MKVLVAISSVPDTTAKINFTADGKSFDPSGVQFVINPYDEFCLTRAMWLKEKNGASVTVVTVGEASTESVIRKALAIGADNAIRVNTNPKDSISVAMEIAKIAQEQSFDILFFGKESIDYNGGVVQGLVAAKLGLPLVNACIGMEVEGSSIKATREVDGGKETVSVSLPVVIGGQKGLVDESDLRIPNMRGIMQARTKPIETVEPSASLGKTAVVAFEKPEGRTHAKMVDANNMEELVRLLAEEAKVI